MTPIPPPSDFDIATTRARLAHQQAIQRAQEHFNSAHEAAVRKWLVRLSKARERNEAMRFAPQSVEAASIRQEYEAASSATPETEPAREQLAREIAEADAVLEVARRELAS